MTRTSIYTFCLTLCFALIFTSCGNKKNATNIAPEYKIMSIDTTTTTIFTEYSATLQSEAVIEIRPKVSGYLKKRNVDEGNLVKKGELLFQIDDADFVQNLNAAEAGMMAAKAQEANAKLEVEKLTPLVKKGIISPYELESATINLAAAKAAYKQNKAQYENAKINLGYTKITAPRDGVLGRIYVREGSLISSSSQSPLTEISSSGDVFAYFSFDEKNINPLRNDLIENSKNEEAPKDNVELLLPDGSTYQYKGTAQSASGIIDRETGSIQIRVSFPNPKLEILSGSSGVLRFPSTLKGCVIIPQSATSPLQDKTMVYILDNENKVTRKNITIIAEVEKSYVIEGLDLGEKIVIEGVDKLKEGMSITPKAE